MPQLKPQRGNALLCTHNKEAKEMEATLRKEIAAKEQEAVEASTKLTDLQTSVRSVSQSPPTVKQPGVGMLSAGNASTGSAREVIASGHACFGP